MTDPQGRTTQYTYCRCGDLKQIIDPLNRITTWKHDVAGRITGKIYADGSSINYAYEPFSGRLQSITDEKGQVKTLAYNTDDTRASVTYTNATVVTPNLAFAYDTYFPRMTSMTDGTGVTAYGYHPIAPGTLGAGMVATVEGPLTNDTIAYAYDELGRSIGHTVNGVGELMGYDALGRINTKATPLGSSGYAYVGATGRLNTMTYPNGMTGAYAYHPLIADFRLQSITHTLPGSVPVSQHTYAFDAHGRFTNWSIQDGASPAASFTAGYDNADRLTSFTSTSRNYGYSYDAADNRSSETIDGATATAHFNSLNEMLAVNSATPLPARALGWDAEDRRVSIDYTGSALRSEFTYDGNNRCVRIVEKNGATVTADRRFVWCGTDRCEERDASGANVLRRFYAEGEQINGQSFYYSRDHLGSIRQVTDGVGTIRARYDYDPYGRRTKLSGDVDANFGFTGHFAHEPSGLALAPFRAYDSRIGRWLSRDPIAERGGTNLFAYVANNPVRFRDIRGHSLSDCLKMVEYSIRIIFSYDRLMKAETRYMDVALLIKAKVPIALPAETEKLQLRARNMLYGGVDNRSFNKVLKSTVKDDTSTELNSLLGPEKNLDRQGDAGWTDESDLDDALGQFALAEAIHSSDENLLKYYTEKCKCPK